MPDSIIAELRHNYLPVTVGRIDTLAKLDSGADINAISSRVIDILPDSVKRRFHPRRETVNCANGGDAQVTGDITIPLFIAGTKINTTFQVMEPCQGDIYLGVPFLRKHEARLRFHGSGPNTVELMLCTPIYAQQFTQIPPRSEIVISGYSKVKMSEGNEGYVFPHGDKLWSAAHAVVTPTYSRVPSG